MIEKISDYKNFNINPWLIEFFKESNLKDVLEIYDNQFNDLENALYDFFTKLWIEEAEGIQLDILGIHVDFARVGFDDESYRTLLKAKIQLNVSSGQPERLILAMRILFNTENIEYIPAYPAKVIMWSDGTFIVLTRANLIDESSNNIVDENGNQIIVDTPNESFYSILLLIVPAGVGLLLADNLITNEGNYYVTNDGHKIIVKNYADNF